MLMEDISRETLDLGVTGCGITRRVTLHMCRLVESTSRMNGLPSYETSEHPHEHSDDRKMNTGSQSSIDISTMDISAPSSHPARTNTKAHQPAAPCPCPPVNLKHRRREQPGIIKVMWLAGLQLAAGPRSVALCCLRPNIRIDPGSRGSEVALSFSCVTIEFDRGTNITSCWAWGSFTWCFERGNNKVRRGHVYRVITKRHGARGTWEDESVPPMDGQDGQRARHRQGQAQGFPSPAKVPTPASGSIPLIIEPRLALAPVVAPWD